MTATLNRDQLAQKFIAYLDATDEQRAQQVKEGHAKERKAHGCVRVARKHRDMWGAVNHRYNGGAGCVFVSCAGHGGVLTSATIQNTIDAELQRNSGYYLDGCGVYEEDCDANIIAAYYPERAEKMGFNYGEGCSTREGAVRGVVTWYEEQVRTLLERVEAPVLA